MGDWRLDADTRVADLVSRMSVREMAGLMMHSPHQMVPGISFGPFRYTYDGKNFAESGAKLWELTDQQKKLLEEDTYEKIFRCQFSEKRDSRGGCPKTRIVKPR